MRKDVWLYDEIKSKGYEDTDARFKEAYSLFLSVRGLGFGSASIVGGFLATFSFAVPILATSAMLFLVFIFLQFFSEHRSKSARDESVKTRTVSLNYTNFQEKGFSSYNTLYCRTGYNSRARFLDTVLRERPRYQLTNRWANLWGQCLLFKHRKHRSYPS